MNQLAPAAGNGDISTSNVFKLYVRKLLGDSRYRIRKRNGFVRA
jgi:hypothetical protein